MEICYLSRNIRWKEIGIKTLIIRKRSITIWSMRMETLMEHVLIIMNMFLLFILYTYYFLLQNDQTLAIQVFYRTSQKKVSEKNWTKQNINHQVAEGKNKHRGWKLGQNNAVIERKSWETNRIVVSTLSTIYETRLNGNWQSIEFYWWAR